MAKTISLINLKGGVGKTTLTVALAEFLVLEHGLRTLVIDLDPQANATACLMDLREWKKKNMRGQTIMRLFLDYFQPWKVFSMKTSLVEKASNINGGVPGLDLIPSGHELMDMQDRLLGLFGTEEEKDRAAYLLAEVLFPVTQAYDYILIDCPPSLGLITKNGLAASDFFLIPVIPENMSMYGIPQIIKRVNQFKKECRSHIRPLGIVVTRYREQNAQHAINVRDLRAGVALKGYQRVFHTCIHEAATAANAVDFYNSPETLSKKYGSGRTYKEYQQLTKEVLSYC